MPSSHLILCHPLLLLPPIPPNIRVFSNESTLHTRWPKYWSFSFSIIPSKEISGLISFRMDWLDLLAVQGTLKSLLQHHSSKASILWCSAFFIVQLSHPCMRKIKHLWVHLCDKLFQNQMKYYIPLFNDSPLPLHLEVTIFDIYKCIPKPYISLIHLFKFYMWYPTT